MSGTARFVGIAPDNANELLKIMAVGDIELYYVDPPLGGCSVVAAVETIWAVRARFAGDPTPPEDPVSTRLYGVTGGEAARVESYYQLHRADGRNVARTFAEAGYRVLGEAGLASHDD
ncbi:MAG TPA: hypothetical protein VG187_15325 [Mycobacterium sp.]|jgi:hypothetical protein|nr:hypothetical protein [Mycobacterium sp.]